MQSALILLSIVAVVTLVLGTVIMIVGLKRAPEGYENEEGFQYAQPRLSQPRGEELAKSEGDAGFDSESESVA